MPRLSCPQPQKTSQTTARTDPNSKKGEPDPRKASNASEISSDSSESAAFHARFAVEFRNLCSNPGLVRPTVQTARFNVTKAQ